jgi:NAD(P)-dependent dehydrogenase (short-subunit alcohol dehydrogenase family)
VKLEGARVLVAGAGGVLGRQMALALQEAGARVVVGSRQEARLRDLAERCGCEPVTFDAVDEGSCRRAVDAAADQLDGLDAIVVTVGAAGFGRALETDGAVSEELFAVNLLGPMALVRAAAPHLSDGGTIAVFSAVLADLPTAGMADYSAAKSALATWLQVLRREERRRFRVLDVRPPHLDTGLETRAIAGSPPRLPPPTSSDDVVRVVLQALVDDADEVVVDTSAGGLVTR